LPADVVVALQSAADGAQTKVITAGSAKVIT
jgi:hypothetical protein